jgi:hypothetical protein
MSTRDFDTEREQREWEAQERALREERAGARSRSDADVAQYRLIARALSTPALSPLPSDFAARVVAKSRVADEGVEEWLERGLLVFLLLAGGVALSVYNGAWLQTLSFSVSEHAALSIQTLASWSIAVAACVGISSAFALARKP